MQNGTVKVGMIVACKLYDIRRGIVRYVDMNTGWASVRPTHKPRITFKVDPLRLELIKNMEENNESTNAVSTPSISSGNSDR